MDVQVTRRGFVKLATDALWALPAVMGGVLAIPPTEARAELMPQSEDSGGPLDPDAPESTIIVLMPSEVGFYVVDMGTPEKKPIAGAHVRITSRYNGKTAEGDTDELGMLALDIAELAVNPDDEPVLDEYFCNATLEVTKEGYRNFKTGILPLKGAKGHFVPTRTTTEGLPYPELVTFDEWDALYTENVFNLGVMNDLRHQLHVCIRDIGEDDDVRLMLYDRTSETVLHEIEDFSDEGVVEGSFGYKFLHLDHSNALAEDMAPAIRFELRDTLYEFPLAIKFEEVVFEQPEQIDNLIAEPFDTGLTDMIKFTPSFDCPIGGKSTFQLWLPEFPISVFLDPTGYVQLMIKSPGFGYKNDFGKTDTNGWQTFPRSSVAEQFDDLVAGWDKSLDKTGNAMSNWSGLGTHVGFTPKITAIANLVLVAAARWDKGRQIFVGDSAAQAGLEINLSLTEQFLAGPVPMFVSFNFKAQFTLSLGLGFTVPLPEGDKHPNLVHVITAMDKYQWDYTNSGLTFSIFIKPSLSVGVGVKGVVSVSLRGSVTINYFIGLLTYRGSLDHKKYPLPHQKASYAFTADVVIEFFLYTRTFKLWEWKDDKWYDNWDQGSKAQALSAEEAANLAGQGTFESEAMTMEEFIDGMRPVTDEMLLASQEFELDGGLEAHAIVDGLMAQGLTDEEGAAVAYQNVEPQVSSEYREDVALGPDGEYMPCMVYTVSMPTVEDLTGAALTNPSEENLVAAAVEGESDPSPDSETDPNPEAQETPESPATPILYAIPGYRSLWDHEAASLRALADGDEDHIGGEPGVKGIGEDGGIKPSLDIEMFDEPIYGNPRVDLVKMQGETIALRIGSVDVGGEPRTRLIATVIDGPLRTSGTSQVLDFPLTKEMQEACPREDLCDYEFSAAPATFGVWDGYAKVTTYHHHLHVTLVSGIRHTDGLGNAATDLVFSYVQFVYNEQEGGVPFTGIFAYVSWQGSRIFSEGTPLYHCLSNVHIKHATDNMGENREYIFYLDRAASTPAGTLLEDASLSMGLIIVKHKDLQTDLSFTVLSPSTIRRFLGGDNVDPTAYELGFWPEASNLDFFYIRGQQWTSYHCMGLGSAGIIERTFYCLGCTTGSEQAHFWKNETYQYLFESVDSRSPKCLICKEDGQLASVHFTFPITPSLQKMEWADVGPSEFGASSFGIWGDFVYWPTSRTVEEGFGSDFDEEGETIPAPSSHQSRIMAARLWNNKFSDPFILADIDHDIDGIVSVSGTGTALTVVSSELVDRETNTGKLWYTSIPFVRTATVIAASCDMPFVSPGGVVEFHITVRNDGNTYIKGCACVMYDMADQHLGDAWEPCDYAQVGFEEYSLIPSVYNPPDEDGKPTNHEDDYALAPGKTGVYLATLMVPMEWEGSHEITFVGAHAWYDLVEDNADELDAQAKPRVVNYHVRPGDIPMDVLTVDTSGVSKTPMDDAPVSVVSRDAGDNADGPSEGGSGAPNSGTRGGDSQLPKGGGNPQVPKRGGNPQLPNTGDGGSMALAGGLAAAGAAVLAYERRRAQNERED